MKRAAQRWMVAHIAGLCLVATTGASAAEVNVTDADRTYRNFTRETATVQKDEIRLEVRGLQEQDDGTTRLDLLGFPVKRLPGVSEGNVSTLSGGIIDFVATYGFVKNAEIGLIIPGYIQSLTLKSGGNKINNSDVGDVMLYGKFQRPLTEHFSVGAGMELTTPNGPVNKGFGTGQVGVNPIISARYQQGRIGVGANVGFNFYNHSVPDVFNYGAEVFLRANKTFSLRTEIIGRVFNEFGVRYDDLQILPGLDVQISENITIRPTGMVGGTNTSLDWGIGAGFAYAFTAPTLQMPTAPPPPPAPVAEPPPPPPAKEKIVLRGVHFAFNKATIRSEDMPILDQAAETLKEHGDIAVTVEGYTDNIGSEEYNQKLSVRRATAVRDYLAQHGIAASRLTVVGKGESDPVASNDTEDGRAQNRRVELLVAS
jgi:outer membrane protein OmpA-like peptidoglycan-associated protein